MAITWHAGNFHEHTACICPEHRNCQQRWNCVNPECAWDPDVRCPSCANFLYAEFMHTLPPEERVWPKDW